MTLFIGFWVIQSCRDVWRIKFRVKMPETMSKTMLENYSNEEALFLSVTMHSIYSLHLGYFSSANLILLLPLLPWLAKKKEWVCSLTLGILSVAFKSKCTMSTSDWWSLDHIIFPGCKGIWEGEYLAFWVFLIVESLCLQPRLIT